MTTKNSATTQLVQNRMRNIEKERQTYNKSREGRDDHRRGDLECKIKKSLDYHRDWSTDRYATH